MDADLSQQMTEYKNWIRAAIAEEEKRRCAWCNSLLNEYHNYRDKFADNDRQFDHEVFFQLMTTSICSESIKTLQKVYSYAAASDNLDVKAILVEYPFLSMFDNSNTVQPCPPSITIKSGDDVRKVIKKEITQLLDYHALDIRKRSEVYVQFFKRLLKPLNVIRESDPALSSLGSKVLGLVRYECIISKIPENDHSRVYKAHLEQILEHIRYITNKMSAENALKGYLNVLMKDKEGVMMLTEWIRNGMKSTPSSSAGAGVPNEVPRDGEHDDDHDDANEHGHHDDNGQNHHDDNSHNHDHHQEEEESFDGEEPMGLVRDENGLRINVVPEILAKLIAMDEQSDDDTLLYEAMGREVGSNNDNEWEEEEKVDSDELRCCQNGKISRIEEEE